MKMIGKNRVEDFKAFCKSQTRVVLSAAVSNCCILTKAISYLLCTMFARLLFMVCTVQ